MKENIIITYFDPNYWIFSVGVSLNRYKESNHQYEWIRKELDIGLLFVGIRISFYFKIKPV